MINLFVILKKGNSHIVINSILIKNNNLYSISLLI